MSCTEFIKYWSLYQEYMKEYQQKKTVEAIAEDASRKEIALNKNERMENSDTDAAKRKAQNSDDEEQFKRKKQKVDDDKTLKIYEDFMHFQQDCKEQKDLEIRFELFKQYVMFMEKPEFARQFSIYEKYATFIENCGASILHWLVENDDRYTNLEDIDKVSLITIIKKCIRK